MNKTDASFSFYLHIISEVWKTTSSLKAPPVPPDPAYAQMSGVSKSLGGWCGTMVQLAEPEKFQIWPAVCTQKAKWDSYVCTKIRIFIFGVEWDIADSEINVPSADKPELSKVTSLKPWVGQN